MITAIVIQVEFVKLLFINSKTQKEKNMIGDIVRNQLDELTPLLKRQQVLESFDDIILTEEETKEALRAGREKKYYELKKGEYSAKLKQKFEPREYTSGEIYDLFAMKMIVDEDNRKIVVNLCYYFANDSKFEGDLNKGLFLYGPVGVGKTSIMKFFIKNQRYSYRMESCRDVESNFAATGEDYIKRCSGNLDVAINSDPFGHKQIGFCFDDLGTESNGKFYGKEKNVMTEILLNRYDSGLPFISTHVTTNLTADNIKQQYGSRVTDRIRQMFNVIEFGANVKSRRS